MRFALYNENQDADEDGVVDQDATFGDFGDDDDQDGDNDDDNGDGADRRNAKRKADKITRDDGASQSTAPASASSRRRIDDDAMEVDGEVTQPSGTDDSQSQKKKQKKDADDAVRSQMVQKTVGSLLAESQGEPVKSSDVLEKVNQQLKKAKSQLLTSAELDQFLEMMQDSNKIMYDDGDIYQV
jgi:hypothetical protein